MKAIVCHAFGPIEQLRLEEVPYRQLASHEVRIQVHAAGANFPDALRAEGLHQIKPALPWIPGSEVAGVITEIGAHVQDLQLGDRVMGISLATGGGFAEELLLPAERVLKVPPAVSLEQAAALPVVYGTSLYALQQRGHLQAGESLLVLGAAGGAGLSAVQLGKLLGARVMAAASTVEKRSLAQRHGADAVVDYTLPNWREAVKAWAGPSGVDLVYDPVGGDAFDEAVRCMAWGGRYLVIGFTSGRIPSLKVNMPLVKGYDLVGVRYDVFRDSCWPQARANLEEVLHWCGQGRFQPEISATYPLSEAVNALRDITSRQTTGKVVLTSTWHHPARL